MTQTKAAPAATSGVSWAEPKPTALLVLADGTVLEGFGLGAAGHAAGEVCFNTAMTGYEEILTDPSYAGQIITFTFPHIGNVGTNAEDIESINPAARGVVLRGDITEPANWRAAKPLDDWLTVSPASDEHETRTGLIIPSAGEVPVISGIVLAIGDEVQGVAPGDKVLFPRAAGMEVRLGGEPVLIVRRRDVVARVGE